MDGILASAIGLFAVALLALVVLTATGSHRRGAPLPLAALSGLLFPLTWVVWYLRDERPYTAR
jgi:hypothetical protein